MTQVIENGKVIRRKMIDFGKPPSEWTDEEAIAEASKYPNKATFKAKSEHAFVCVSYRNLWSRIPGLSVRRPGAGNGVRRISDEEVIERIDALGCIGKGRLRTEHQNLYMLARTRDLWNRLLKLDDPKGRSDAELFRVAREYRTVCEFAEGDPDAYGAVRARKLLESMDWLEDDRS